MRLRHGLLVILITVATAAAALDPLAAEITSSATASQSTAQNAPLPTTDSIIAAKVEAVPSDTRNEFVSSSAAIHGVVRDALSSNTAIVSLESAAVTPSKSKIEIVPLPIAVVPNVPTSDSSDDIDTSAVSKPNDQKTDRNGSNNSEVSDAVEKDTELVSSPNANHILIKALVELSMPTEKHSPSNVPFLESGVVQDKISSKSFELTNTDGAEGMVAVSINHEDTVVTESFDFVLPSTSGSVTTDALKKKSYNFYEQTEDSVVLNESKVKMDGLEHCDPVFPPPLRGSRKTNNVADGYIIIEEQRGQLEVDSIKRDTESMRKSNLYGENYGVSNIAIISETDHESKIFLGEKEISVESINTYRSKFDDTQTDILEVLPTPAAFNIHQDDYNKENIILNNSIASDNSKFKKPSKPLSSNFSDKKAQIRQEDSNRFVFQIPAFYDVHPTEPTTETTFPLSTTQLEDGNPPLDANNSSKSFSASSSLTPKVDQPPPSAVAQIRRYDVYEDDPRDNDASAADGGGASRSPASRPRGRPGSDGVATALDSPPTPVLEFPPLPTGEGFRVNDLGLSDGVFMFKYLGSFLSWMQPYDFPVELLRDALWKRVSVANLIGQCLPVEAGFLACLCVGVALALAAPLYALGHACCSLCGRRRGGRSGAPPAQPHAAWDDDSASASQHSGCRRRALLFVLDVLLMLMVGGVVAMFVTNEQLSGAVARSPAVLHTALGDAATFLRNTNLQLHFVVTKSLDRAVEAASLDLENVETLLGKPIQRQLEEETGVGVALDALVDVTSSAQDVAGRVAGLVERAAEARGLALVAQERLADLRLQVDALRRQCPAKDRALCDTVEAGGLAVTMQLDGLLADERLLVLRRLSEGNLSATAQQARGEFQFIPTHVEQQTRDARSGVRRQLLRQRGLLDDSAWALDALSRDLGARVEEARERAMRVAEAAADLEYWRYMAAVGMAAAVLLLWTLLLAALSCGCCGAEEKARPTLFAWVGVLCPVYLALWAATLLALLVGGHGEVFVCRPLYDEPGFGALTALVDRPGVLFQRRGGFFSNLLYGNDSLDVPLRDVLRACEQNRPSYPAFKLQQVLDVDVATDHRRWEQLHRQLGRLDVDLTQLQLLTPALQVQLSSLLNAALVNLTSHRAQLTRPVTGKDLTTFADQLESVANQITDLATASRMETLASRTRRLLTSHMEPLKLRKEDLVYQITALEVQLVPLQRQVNQSLSHLKTIQFFINNQGANISHTKSREYTGRLVSYVQQYREHVLRATGETAAPCRPVWDLFHAVRQLLCRHIMDPLNGFWFGALWCLLLLLAATPLAVRLAESYPRGASHGLLHRAAAETPPEPPIMPEQATWSTPGYVQKMYSAQSIESLNNDTYAMYEKKF